MTEFRTRALESRGFEQEQLTLTGPLAQTIGINLVLGFVNSGGDNVCHVGGLFSGAVVGARANPREAASKTW